MNPIIETLKGATPWDVFLAAGPILKLAVMIIVVVGIVVVILAIMRKASGGRRSGALGSLAWVALVTGLLAVLYTGGISLVAYNQIHGTNPFVMLPALVECVYTLILAGLVWLVAAFGNAGTKTR